MAKGKKPGEGQGENLSPRGVSRRGLLKGAAVLGAAGVVGPAAAVSATASAAATTGASSALPVVRTISNILADPLVDAASKRTLAFQIWADRSIFEQISNIFGTSDNIRQHATLDIINEGLPSKPKPHIVLSNVKKLLKDPDWYEDYAQSLRIITEHDGVVDEAKLNRGLRALDFIRDNITRSGGDTSAIARHVQQLFDHSQSELGVWIKQVRPAELVEYMGANMRENGLHVGHRMERLMLTRGDYEELANQAMQLERLERLKNLQQEIREFDAGKRKDLRDEDDRYTEEGEEIPFKQPHLTKYTTRELKSLTSGKWTFALEFPAPRSMTAEEAMQTLRPYFENKQLLEDPKHSTVTWNEADNSIHLTTDAVSVREIMRASLDRSPIQAARR